MELDPALIQSEKLDTDEEQFWLYQLHPRAPQPFPRALQVDVDRNGDRAVPLAEYMLNVPITVAKGI